jgi:hypothetical protein
MYSAHSGEVTRQALIQLDGLLALLLLPLLLLLQIVTQLPRVMPKTNAFKCHVHITSQHGINITSKLRIMTTAVVRFSNHAAAAATAAAAAAALTCIFWCCCTICTAATADDSLLQLLPLSLLILDNSMPAAAATPAAAAAAHLPHLHVPGAAAQSAPLLLKSHTRTQSAAG